MGVKVGIDLGTTFSAVAWKNPRTGAFEVVKSDEKSNALITPSAVRVFDDGSYVCGAQAKEAFEDAEEGVATAFKRCMGTNEFHPMMPDGKEYDPITLSSMLLKHLVRNAEKTIGQKIDEAVITVPAYFEDGPRNATMKAAELAGLKVQKLINEPTAAAMHYGLGHWRENAKILVYDLGGGTFDITLVGMQANTNLCTIGTIGEHKRGGKDWDERLVEMVVEKFIEETGCSREDINIADLRSEAESWKISLTFKDSIRVTTRVNGYGPAAVEVSRSEFDRATRDLLELTGNLCERLLSDLKVRWNDITDVLLVGGSTRMPQVSEYLTEKAGKKPIAHVNPDQAVAIGAAMCANMSDEQFGDELVVRDGKAQSSELLAELKKPVKDAEAVELIDFGVSDCVAHSLGIILVDVKKREYVNETIIPKYTQVPCKRAVAAEHESDELVVYVLQGDGKIADCTVNQKYIVSGIKVKPGKKTMLRVQYSYDRNHRIHVQVRQDKENTDLPIRIEPFTDEEIEQYCRPISEELIEQMRQANQTFVFALDVSGSMADTGSATPLSDAKNAIKQFIMDHPGAKYGVIAVSDRSEWVISPTPDMNAALRSVDSIRCGQTGPCNSAHPFREIKDGFRENGEYVAFVMADGMWEDQPAAVAAAKECHKMGIKVFGMGFGHADKKFLRDISSNPDEAQYSNDSKGLSGSFGRIAQTLGSGKKGMKGSSSSENQKDCPTWETSSQ